jgi:hypothetical protein
MYLRISELFRNSLFHQQFRIFSYKSSINTSHAEYLFIFIAQST